MKALRFWEYAKDWLAFTFHVTHWTLHVIVGLGLFLLFKRLLRVPFSSMMPLLPIAALEAANEAVDFTRFYVSNWPWTPRSTMIEVALTLVPPSAIIGVARWREQALRRSRPVSADEAKS